MNETRGNTMKLLQGRSPLLQEEVLSSLEAYCAEVERTPRLSPEEEYALAVRYRRGDVQAGQTLIVCNLRLAASLAFACEWTGASFDRLDLIQEANLGLMRALESYEPERGYHFSTYAVLWIRQRITRYAHAHRHPVRLPEYVMIAHGRGETTHQGHEISHLLAAAVPWAEHCTSFDIPLNEEDGGTLAEVVADPTQPTDLSDLFVQPDLSEAIASLPPRWREVITLHYGLGCEGLPCHTIAQRIGISIQRVRQIEQQALLALRRALTDSSPDERPMRANAGLFPLSEGAHRADCTVQTFSAWLSRLGLVPHKVAGNRCKMVTMEEIEQVHAAIHRSMQHKARKGVRYA